MEKEMRGLKPMALQSQVWCFTELSYSPNSDDFEHSIWSRSRNEHVHKWLRLSCKTFLPQAQNIKNFKSQRWQMLLNFSSQRRLLLTGTPLQNSLMELWSLMHFLMPNVFQSHRDFKEWFSNPLTGMIEGSQEYNESLVKRLHKVRVCLQAGAVGVS